MYVYYKSCLDPNGTIEQLGGRPLLDSLADIGGGGWRILAKPGCHQSRILSFAEKLTRVA